MKANEKHVAFIASGGRTGTLFFGEILSEIIDDAFSVHEPDLLHGVSRRSWHAIRTFGFYHMVLGRLMRRTGIRNLTQKFLSGEMTIKDVVTAIHRHRDRYYARVSQGYVIESYYQWYGILPAVAQAFPNYKIVGIVRDPRTWVTSFMRFGGRYDKHDLVARYRFKRLEPSMIGDDAYAQAWPRMSSFAKNCWHWKVITRLLQEHAAHDQNMRLYRYEDLFLSEDRATQVEDMLRFMVTFTDRTFPYRFDPDIMKRIKNRSHPGDFPDWLGWTPEMAQELMSLCGPLMQDLGYGFESDWIAKLEQN